MSPTSGHKHESRLMQKWPENQANAYCMDKEHASCFCKCLLAMKIKISRYLEDRLTVNDRICKPQDSHFRYPDSITAHFIDGPRFTRSL